LIEWLYKRGFTVFEGVYVLQYGGNDVLQIYNVHQVKHRLNTTGMYIASTKVSWHIVINP